MDNATVIAKVEMDLPKEILNGRYIRGPINVPLKTFLEEVLVNFISEGSTYEQVYNYINTKVLPDVIAAQEVKDVSIDFGALHNEDVQAQEDKNVTTEPLAPIIDLPKDEFIPINPLLGKQCVDEFIKNYVGFVDTVRTSDVAVVDTREYLYSKIAFMNSDQKIRIGETYKTIEEVYNILLNNSYRPASLVDKTELCTYLAEELEPEVLSSIIKELNMSTKEYILEVLPKMMINATDIAVAGNIVSVDKAIDQIAKKQREMINKEREQENAAKIEEFNRTGENPSLLSEIKLELDKEEDSIEVTAEIPIVSSYLVSPEEVTALSVLPTDTIYGNDDQYYQRLLNNLKQTIKDTSTEHDLTAKESGNNNFSFEVIAQEALQKIPTFEMQQLINSTSELIGTKRNELIKVYSNREEYCDTIMAEINTIARNLELVDSIDSFSEIKNQITRITIDLVEKNIKDMRVKQALDNLTMAYRQAFTKYNLTQNDFEKQKNRIVEGLNTLLSSIRRNYASLLYIQDYNLSQSAITSTNLSVEELKDKIQSAIDSHFLTEDEANNYYHELNKLNTLGTIKNRLGT